MAEHTHRCPWPGCSAQVPRRHFACRDHWRLTPMVLKDRITGARWNTPEHRRAMYDAMKWMQVAANTRR